MYMCIYTHILSGGVTDLLTRASRLYPCSWRWVYYEEADEDPRAPSMYIVPTWTAKVCRFLAF